MNRKVLFIGSLIFLLALSACAGLLGKSADHLNGTSWTLESYGGESLIGETAMTADFSSGEVSGSASCNHYFGAYQINGDQITVEGLGWTEMACLNPQGIMEQEMALMSLLSEAASYQIKDGKLYLKVESGEELVFLSIEEE